MRRRLAAEDGQVLPLLAAGLLVALLGFAGLAIDLGGWYHAHRHAQAVADAAALAAAQALPAASASALAASYATTNCVGVNGCGIDTPSISPTGDTITVQAHETAPSYFARVFGIGDVTVKASASARLYALAALGNVVPIAISAGEPALTHCGGPCFGQQTSLQFGKIEGLGGGFGLLDFTNSNGNVTPSQLADWIATGFQGELQIGQYQSPGNRYSSAAVRSALAQLASQQPTVLVPVYSSYSGSGTSGSYVIDGFGAFRVDSYDASAKVMTGSFQHLVAHGPHLRGRGAKYYGVSEIGLSG